MELPCLNYSPVGRDNELMKQSETLLNYFTGDNPNDWHTDVPTWSGVRYLELYPGIDLEITNGTGLLLPRFVCHANCLSALQGVHLQVEGAEASQLMDGQLILTTGVGEFAFPPLGLVFNDSTTLSIFNLTPHLENNTISFLLTSSSTYTRSSTTLQTQPNNLTGLLYGTFLGGSNNDYTESFAIDESGNTYIVGTTSSPDFPTTPGAFDPTLNGGQDAFVVKLDPDGSDLIYSTFFGGISGDVGVSIAVDVTGNVYVVGFTDSADLPTTPGAYDLTYNGSSDIFMVKLNSVGNLDYATFLGTDLGDVGMGIAVDALGDVYIIGGTSSVNFPTTPDAFDPTYNGSFDTFIVKLDLANSDLVYATFLGGNALDEGKSIVVDETGNAYATGTTYSTDFPITPDAFDPTYNGGDKDVFAIKINPTGSALVYATFLGGNSSDYGESIAIDGSGNAYITGFTYSADFPTTPDAFNTTHNGGWEDAFVVKLNSVGNDLVYGTFLGGETNPTGGFTGNDAGLGVFVDGVGNAYVTGVTNSNAFPTTPGAFDSTYNGYDHFDAFIVKFNPTGSNLVYGSFLGGDSNFEDRGYGITVDGIGNVYIAGYTYSDTFPTTPDAYDPTYNGFQDAFVLKLVLVETTSFTASGQIQDAVNNPIAGVTISTNMGQTAVTDNGGNYLITDLIAGTYTITPTLSAYSFDPPFRTITVPPNAENQGFIGVPNLPGSISNFNSVPGTQGDEVTLTWTAPADYQGLAVQSYDLRYSALPITDLNWQSATAINGEPTPASPGSFRSMTINTIPDYGGHRWYFAIKSVDDQGQQSDLSNVPSIIDTGFRVYTDGYGFSNYGGMYAADFTMDDMRRMFGNEAVCWLDGTQCVEYKPEAIVWNIQALEYMDGGHCDGMAVTSLRFFTQLDEPGQFQGDANVTHDLLQVNVRRHIAYYFAKQLTDPVEGYKNQIRQNTPEEILGILTQAMLGNVATTIFVRQSGEGHAITPYAIEEKGNGVYWIRVYDNNHPDDPNHYIVINSTNNTWSYIKDWTVWYGNAHTHSLGIVPIITYSLE